MKKFYRRSIVLTIVALLLSACAKDQNIIFNDNTPVDPTGVPTIVVENYVNRLFIDLLGRAPTDVELAKYTNLLKDNDLAESTRLEIIKTLQSDSIEVHNDGTYRDVYYYNFHNSIKAKCIEGASDGELTRLIGNLSFDLRIARLLGDSIRVFRDSANIKRIAGLVRAHQEYKNGEIDIRDYFMFALNNPVYDEINMNSFNFVNASFDDLYSRFPTAYEFQQAYEIINFNRAGFLFGGSATNKNEYCRLLTNSNEFTEGIVRWQYILMVSREPTTTELANFMKSFHSTKDVQWVQQEILKTDEYANFK